MLDVVPVASYMYSRSSLLAGGGGGGDSPLEHRQYSCAAAEHLNELYRPYCMSCTSVRYV